MEGRVGKLNIDHIELCSNRSEMWHRFRRALWHRRRDVMESFVGQRRVNFRGRKESKGWIMRL